MSIIEKATKRLEELRRAGVEVPWNTEPQPVPGARVTTHPASLPVTPLPLAGVAPLHLAPGAAQQVQESAEQSSRSVEIDMRQLARMGLLDPTAPRSRLSDELRVLKRPIIANATGQNNHPVARGNLVMVTSTVPGEGKTFMSINLALSIAMEFDSQVLLVDADTVRPAVLDRLGLPQSPGLLDRLTDPTRPLSELLLRTNVDKLTLLSAGTSHAHATEMLASAGMDQFLDELSRRYPDRMIIFDAPPLLPSPEARVLATRMGQVVLIVEAGKTTHSMVKQALATIESCPIVLTALNKWRGFGSGLGGYGYYAY